MGVPVLILGESGSGKTYSIRNLDPKTTGIYLVEKPRLPFRQQFPNTLKDADYPHIIASLKMAKLKRYVIDDSQYLMANEFFDRCNEVGYQKFTDIATNFRNLIHNVIIRGTPEDCIVYLLHHTETDANGRTKCKTIGKMLDEKLTVEGLFDIVLRTTITPEGRFFVTQSNGTDTVKSPEGMFPEMVPNDLAVVDQAIREYYGMEDKKK